MRTGFCTASFRCCDGERAQVLQQRPTTCVVFPVALTELRKIQPPPDPRLLHPVQARRNLQPRFAYALRLQQHKAAAQSVRADEHFLPIFQCLVSKAFEAVVACDEECLGVFVAWEGGCARDGIVCAAERGHEGEEVVVVARVGGGVAEELLVHAGPKQLARRFGGRGYRHVDCVGDVG